MESICKLHRPYPRGMLPPYRISSYATCCHCSSAQTKNMSNKIDEFLTTVQRCEMELQEEYETRQRRMAAARARRVTSGSGCMSRPRPQGARSASTASVTSANRTLDCFSKQPPAPGCNRRQSAQVNKPASNVGSSSMTGANRSFNGTPTGPTSRSFSNGRNQMAVVKQPPLVMRSKVPRRRPGSSQTYASSRARAPLKATSAVASGGAVYPMPDTSKIGSRLKEDKTHYQPPRRRPIAKSRWGFVRKMFSTSVVQYRAITKAKPNKGNGHAHTHLKVCAVIP